MEADEAEQLQLVEHRAGALPVAHAEGEVGVCEVGEAVHLGHVERATPDLGGYIEHAAAPHRGQLRTVSDERDGCSALCRNREQRKRGVLVEHPCLVHHDPLTPPQPRRARRAGEGCAGLGIGVADGEARPDAIHVPAVAVRVHERCDRPSGHTEFLPRDVGGALGRRHHPHCPAEPLRCGDRGGEHRGLARPGGTLHDHQRIGGRDRCGGAQLPGI